MMYTALWRSAFVCCTNPKVSLASGFDSLSTGSLQPGTVVGGLCLAYAHVSLAAEVLSQPAVV